jgi:peptidyl-dipeptidase Dcp
MALGAAALSLSLGLAACSSSGDMAEPEAQTQMEAAESSETKTYMNESNPFAQNSPLPFMAPDFDTIEFEHYRPAFMAGMEQQIDEIEAIANNPEAPTFENTMVAMEKSGRILTRVQRVFYNLTSSNTNEQLQALQAELSPMLSEHSDNIMLNQKLFERIETLHSERDNLELNTEQRQLLEETYRDFVRSGARLSDAEQARIREINSRLSSLGTQFSENVLTTTRERAVVIDSAEELAGMSEGAIRAAAEAADERGHEGKYLLTLTNTTRQPVTASLDNRETRRKVWEASAYRGLGKDGHIDNQPLILEIAELRAERAELLGYDNFAAYRLDAQMASTPDAATEILVNMLPAVKENTRAEAELIRSMMQDDGIEGEIQPWDWEYYAEKVREAEYNVDPDEIKAYFELDSVLKNGVFFAMEKQYGVTFEERYDLPVYHPDVRTFNVFNADGSQIGLFYADYFARDGKRGGAWMNSFVVQNDMRGFKPVIVNVMNIPKPVEGEPALVSLDNVMTMFHEMGHAVHGLFSDVTYPSVAGTSTPRDFVEFPSTYQEDWAIEPVILENYALHYETGELIPQALLDRFLEAQKFNQGFDTFEYLAAALLDMDWHTLSSGEIPSDVEQYEADVLAKYGINWDYVPPRYKSGYFNHVWPGGYAASYYAYLWSEVLAADAFAYVNEQGGIDSEAATRYREQILSQGGSEDPMTLYVNFRGQEPGVEALLRRRGLVTE